MNTQQLGRLESIDVREVWNNEATHFTPWLAKENNLALLASTIGLDLELQGQEQSVGPYRADILCKDTVTDTWVLIENQLEPTDHNHLGQLITYAAGLNAVTIVWIADRFTDEHRAAMDWLNEISDETTNFFGLEIELWQIGKSAMAPKFNIVSKPNEWIKTRGGGLGIGGRKLSDGQKLQLAYWTKFKEYLEDSGSYLKARKPYPAGWMEFAIGRSYFWTAALTTIREKRIGVALLITGPDVVPHYKLLEMDKESIESSVGAGLDWDFKDGRKQNYIYLHNNDMDISDQKDWPNQHTWLREKLELFQTVFKARVRSLDASEVDMFETVDPLDI